MVLFASAMLALVGCSSFSDTETITTGALPTPAPVKVDPACNGLSAQITLLRQEGIGDKISNAAAKKYKMTPDDLAKADQLTKLNADFQAKCGLDAKPVVQQAAVAPAAPKAAAVIAPVQAPAKPAALTKTQ
jgi:hypothetical protein